MNTLFGLVQPDAGQIVLRGRPVVFRSPHDALAAGIGMVHQTRRLVAAHTVVENVILGHPGARGLLDLRRARDDLEAYCARYGIVLDLGARVWQLSEGEKQWVEILKALYGGARILILDEPTSALTPPEVTTLLDVLRGMVTAHGLTVLLVTHKLPVVMAIGHRVTVLRAGRVVARLPTAEATEATLVQHMIGQDVAAPAVTAAAAAGQPVLEVDRLAAYNDKNLVALRGLSFTLHAGEILGVAGVTGNGQEELAQVLAGLRPAASGTVRLQGRDITAATPLERWRLGFGYIPAERTTVASVAAFSLVENIGLNFHFDPAYTRRGRFDYARLEDLTARILATFRVQAPGPRVQAQQLSGGNLQKLVLGRVLARAPRVLIAHLPTQGLDVEAAAFVRGRLLDARARGAAVLLISEDLDEILTLSDRVAAMYEGRFVAILPREAADAETVGAMMAGLRPAGGGGP
jgi:simple sugar transport system ATP-binding protein